MTKQAPAPTPSLERRYELIAADVTLNGEPAVISGVFMRFATVRQRRSGLSAEWAWSTVERVVSNGGAFRS